MKPIAKRTVDARSESHLRLKGIIPQNIKDFKETQEEKDFRWIGDEMEAQTLAMRYVFYGKGTDEDVSAAAWLAQAQRPEPTCVSEHLIQTCLSLVVGMGLKDIPKNLIAAEQGLVQRVFESFSLAWMHWVLEGNQEILTIGEHPQEFDPGLSPNERAELTALHIWLRALELSVKKEYKEADTLFRTAIELCDRVGAESESAIKWTYVTIFLMARRIEPSVVLPPALRFTGGPIPRKNEPH